MASETPFKPHFGSNQPIVPIATVAQVTINAKDKSVRVVNTSATAGFHFKFGTAAQIAATPVTVNDCYVHFNETQTFEKADGDDTFAFIRSGVVDGTGFVMTGEGGIGQ